MDTTHQGSDISHRECFSSATNMHDNAGIVTIETEQLISATDTNSQTEGVSTTAHACPRLWMDCVDPRFNSTVTARHCPGTIPLLQLESMTITIDCYCWSLPGYTEAKVLMSFVTIANKSLSLRVFEKEQ